MEKITRFLKNSNGVVMVISLVIMLAVTAIGIAMVANAAMSSTIAKNYRNEIQSFYAADGQMTMLSQAVIDSTDTNWTRVSLWRGKKCGNAYTFVSDSASSVNGTNVASFAIDGNQTTRWESTQGVDPQWIWVNLGSSKKIYCVAIDWENASAASYHLDGSNDKSTWTTLKSLSGLTGARTDSITGLSGNYQYIRIYGLTRSTTYGYSIYEISVYPDTLGMASNDTLFPRSLITMTASSTNAGSPANVNDGNSSTSWTSNASDPQWIYANCGSPIYISKVIINWAHNSSGKSYTIDGSTDGKYWTTIKSFSSTDTTNQRLDTISGLTGSYQYIRMSGATRNGSSGYCINEMPIYAYSVAPRLDTTIYGRYKVQWSVQMVDTDMYTISTLSWDSLQKWGQVFKTPLKQSIEKLGNLKSMAPSQLDTVKVRFYDFHSGRVCPEFENVHRSGVHKNMVSQYLDGQRKPQVGTQPRTNQYIKYWFRDWNGAGGGKGDSTIPIYLNVVSPWKDTSPCTVLRYDTKHFTAARGNSLRRWVYDGTPKWGACHVNELAWPDSLFKIDTTVKNGGILNDTAFKNAIVDTFLVFNLSDPTTGTYSYGNGAFFLLDNKGFGKEWSTENTGVGDSTYISQHNYSFTMSMDTTFIMVPGLKFCFTGDDDIWLYLNNRLEMDLGGPHQAASDTVLVDTVAGLTNYQKYNFDFFYCERHSVNSDIYITTNMLVFHRKTFNERSWHRDYGFTD
ncbi:MAG TPA: discoidin domain-containing protein [Chitinivibrionales bacterium]|nr:discoidin domain-containing protein [Chitinivibrionales bacterium]